jgi:immune inhibitor A
VNFRPYDNDGNGYVDAFIVVHAGPGAEVTGNAGDIWSHKWVLPAAFNTDTTRIYAYLTVPEDARLGVCAHELGHLLFGWPDLYDTDYSSEGIGNWCLMAGGSWGNGGDTPVHPSAWCKVNQGWVSVVTPTTNGTVTFADVKASHAVHRLWKDGAPGSEYFLVENRQRTQFDAFLPGQGLLVWHVDETISGNADERHYKVALVQADNRKDLEGGRNRGDAGDPYPGSAGNTAFTATSAPNSKSYNGADTCVAITSVAPSGATMTARVSVRCGTTKSPLTEKPPRLEKSARSEKLFQEKPLFDKRPEKPVTDKLSAFDKPPFSEFTSAAGGGSGGGGYAGGGYAGGARDATGELLLRVVASLAERVDVLESQLARGGATGGADAGGQPFIDQSQRPDLTGGALSQEDDQEELRRQMQENDAGAKRIYDTKAPER